MSPRSVMACVLAAASVVATAAIARADAKAALPDPCAGLFAVIDRPTVADSPCSVRPGHGEYEAGWTRQFNGGDIPGTVDTLPQAELRFGYAHGIELKLFPPSRLRQMLAAPGGESSIVSGYGDCAIGLKDEIEYTARWIVATDALVSLPTGTNGFSAGGPSETVKGIFAYSLTPTIGLSANVALASQVGAKPDGSAARFGSVNSTFVVSDQLSARVQTFGEIYGTSASSPSQGGRYAADGGVQYLPNPSFEVDIEIGSGLGPAAASRMHSFGFGFGVML